LEKCSEERFDQILKLIRKITASKGMSFIELFKFIDFDKTGLISEKKFSKRMREIIPGLSRLACD
jgi:Ca2+-binding EF-hand superfamily protein